MKQLDDFLLLHGYGRRAIYSSKTDHNKRYIYENSFNEIFVQVIFSYDSIKNKLSYKGNRNKIRIAVQDNVLPNGMSLYQTIQNLQNMQTIEYISTPNECIEFLLKNKFCQMHIVRDTILNNII